jgi:hypothetical protein
MKISLYKSFTIHVILFLMLVSFISPVASHHSFAVYDIDNKIERTGVLTKFQFAQPHIRLLLKVVHDDGTIENWDIESMAPRRWDSFGHDRDFAKEGETVTIIGWPARDGSDKMALSTIITERGKMVVLNEVRQRRAREDVPEVTIKRE